MNHGVLLEQGLFDGRGAYVEVPANPQLKLGTNDFTLSAWVYTEEELSDVLGDVLELYDPSLRRGITFSIYSSSSGYQGQGSDRHLLFGIDNARLSGWSDCGRPSATSSYISNSMVVHDGKLYVAITDAADEKGWCHVFRYEDDGRWIDCGRVGTGRTTGVGPLIVHRGALYAVTWTYDWTRVQSGNYEPGRVYRYEGGTEWRDCGQPSDNRTLNCAAHYKGKLYVGGGPNTWGVFAQDETGHWQSSHIFSKTGPRRCFPHAMSRHNGLLYTAYPAVYAFDGNHWTYAGLPAALEQTPSLQTHSLTVYQGQLCAGTWPQAVVSSYQGAEQWQEMGRVGDDGTEVNALTVYNGKLYGGSIPRAEVCRYDGQRKWTSLKRFYSPENWDPAPPGNASPEEVKEWSRVTSLTIHRGQLFAGIGSCTSAVQDAHPDVRGKVFRIEAGKCASYDGDLGPGWKHLTAVRAHDRLRLYVDGKLASQSTAFDPAEFDLSVDGPLRIGRGQIDSFAGKIREVSIYNRALSAEEIQTLAALKPD